MRYTRTGIIIALAGAEIFIAGAILAILGGHHGWAGASETRNAAFVARAIEPIDAGPYPKVEIDDSDSTVSVGLSTDGRIHVTDNTTQGGAVFTRQAPAQLVAERTADGVRISRPSEGDVWIALAGWFDRRISVDVPADASVDIVACSGAEIHGLNGSLRVRSDDGDITASDLTGSTDVHSSDGRIELTNVRAKNIIASTNDGDLRLRDIAADSLEGSTSDGEIDATGLQTAGGSLQSNDGAIQLSFRSTNVTIHAHTDDGSVSFDGRKTDSNDSDSSSGDFHIGSGGGSLQVATQDGDIHILTNGAQ